MGGARCRSTSKRLERLLPGCLDNFSDGFERIFPHDIGAPARPPLWLPAAAANLIVRPNNSALVDALEHPDTWLGGAAKRDQLLTSSLTEAYAATSALLGPDPTKWKWGDLQFTLFQHPLSPLLGDTDRARFNVGPIRHGGDETVVNASGFQAANFQQTGGPTVRMVFDVGNWDASRGVNSPGQSGDPNSPHYRDLAPYWANGATFPLLYSRAAVERNAQQRFLLVPWH